MQLILGDCLEKLREMLSDSVESIVTDPPYGLSFMGKKWDYDVPSIEVWQECLRVLKPGGHLLSFAGSRTYHRMAVRIEDAGFEIRDQIMWVYGSGFPKSLDVSKAIDKAAVAERVILEERPAFGIGGNGCLGGHAEGATFKIDAGPATEQAKQWQGWGTALKPAHEPIVVARKPLVGTVAANVLAHGTGALNIDGCRVGMDRHVIKGGGGGIGTGWGEKKEINAERFGRFPANFIHDGLDEVWAKYFYCPKASKKDRGSGGYKNTHATVKPTELMRYLCRLVTPLGGTVLDPFMGSGSTGKAAKLEGFDFIGFEREEEYLHIAEARIKAAM